MSLSTIFITVSTIIAFLTPVIGIVSIFKGEYKPQRTTRMIFTIISAIVLVSLFFANDTTAIYLAIPSFLSCFAIFILSILYGIGGTSKSDFGALFFALLAIVAWRTTDNPLWALYLSILADFFGIIPTIIKIKNQPYTESIGFYISDILASLFSCLALLVNSELGIIEKSTYSIYILSINIVVLSYVLICQKLQPKT